MKDDEDPVPLVVFDCQLFLQTALRGTGPAAACFDLVENGQVLLAMSDAVWAEIRDVLTRPKLLRKYPQLASPRVGEFLAAVAEQALHVDPVPETFTYPRDPKDQPYLNLAITAGAQYLVSRDQDLLDLQAGSSAPGRELRQHSPSLIILDPVEFLKRLEPTADQTI